MTSPLRPELEKLQQKTRELLQASEWRRGALAMSWKTLLADWLNLSQETPLSAAVPQEGWQPIETAPKDGTRVSIANSEQVDLSHWVRWTKDGVVSGNWMGWTWRHAPTHWMPLPAPPEVL